jgi:hypothetical protein
MVLDRPISFNESELNFGNYQAPRSPIAVAPDAGANPHSTVPLTRRR